MKLSKAVLQAWLNAKAKEDTDEIDVPDELLTGAAQTQKETNKTADELLATLLAQQTQQQTQTQQKEEPKPIFAEGFDVDKPDVSKINDPEVKKMFETLLANQEATNNSKLIEEAIDLEMKNYNIKVKPETIKSLLNREGITVKDGKVEGVKQCFDSLAKNDTSLFGKYQKVTSPLDENFSPINKGGDGQMSEEELINMAYGQEE